MRTFRQRAVTLLPCKRCGHNKRVNQVGLCVTCQTLYRKIQGSQPDISPVEFIALYPPQKKRRATTTSLPFSEETAPKPEIPPDPLATEESVRKQPGKKTTLLDEQLQSLRNGRRSCLLIYNNKTCGNPQCLTGCLFQQALEAQGIVELSSERSTM